MENSILRLPAVQALSGLSRSTIYLRISQGLWPAAVNLGDRAVGWPSGEVAAINSARIAGQSNDEIRGLVARLVEARKSPVRIGPMANQVRQPRHDDQ